MHYIRKQTLTNVERYMTEELKKHESDVFSAQFKSIELEQKIFNDLVEYSKNEKIPMEYLDFVFWYDATNDIFE